MRIQNHRQMTTRHVDSTMSNMMTGKKRRDSKKKIVTKTIWLNKRPDWVHWCLWYALLWSSLLSWYFYTC